MAKIYPTFDHNLIENDAEKLVLQSLELLPDGYHIFYSFRWIQFDGKYRKQDGEADFIVIHPKKGLVVIEVKRGHVSSQHGNWFYQSGRKMNEDPLEQARKSMYKIVDEIEQRDPTQKLNKYSCVWFPHTYISELPKQLPLNYDRRQILSFENLSNPEQSLNNLFNINNIDKNSYEAKNIVNLISPSFNFIESLSNIVNRNNKIFLMLTNEQIKLLDYLDEQERAVIHGSAGTGKTLIAMQKANRIASANNRVLFLCFNSYLKNELKERNNNAFIDVENIHSYAAKLLNTNEVSEDDINWILSEQNNKNFQYDSIIIDEAQDFSENTILYLDRLVRKHFYLFYDKNQMIQKFEIPKWLEYSECRLILSKNCRNTINIAKTSIAPIHISLNKNLNNAEGIQPYLYSNSTNEQIFQKLDSSINKLVTENGIKYDQIVLLTVKTEETSILSDSDLLKRIEKKGVKFTTARKFKGLESDVIILLDLDSEFFNESKYDQILYVASSRARNLLYLFFKTNDEENHIIAKKISDLPKPKRGISALLRALNAQELVE